MKRTIGSSTLTTSNRTRELERELQRRKQRAVQAMAQEAALQAHEVYLTDGDGTWEPNAEATIQWKGFNGPMRGLTATLSREIRVWESPHPYIMRVGWTDDPHPDTEGRLGIGALAYLHEVGMEGPVAVPARPWLSKVADTPWREDAVLKAGMREYRA